MLKEVVHRSHHLWQCFPRHLHCHDWSPVNSKARSRSGRGSVSWRKPLFCMASYHRDVVLATNAVRLASRLCQTVQRGLLTQETQTKSDKSPVTVADYGSQALVNWSLAREFPPGTFSMVAEEGSEDLRTEAGAPMLERITQLVNDAIASDAALDVAPLSKEDVLEAIDWGNSEGGSNGRHWVLDPIDGTRGFVRGDQYAIALGLLDNGKVVAGVLGCPNLPMGSIANGIPANSSEPVGCLFVASLGAGTTVEPLDGSGEPKRVHVSDVEDTAIATFCESYESAHTMQDLTANIAGTLGVKAPPVRIDSQAKYGAMARGDAVIYLRFPHFGYREKIWDHAAGAIVITEAGGEVFDAAEMREGSENTCQTLSSTWFGSQLLFVNLGLSCLDSAVGTQKICQ
uniref:3'(2'),5'-bisphosphate nucleotidase n=1 Tax=Physcomitrium patens TaxID=3218 RepID=A0A7I4B3P8_PHYPA